MDLDFSQQDNFIVIAGDILTSYSCSKDENNQRDDDGYVHHLSEISTHVDQRIWSIVLQPITNTDLFRLTNL